MRPTFLLWLAALAIPVSADTSARRGGVDYRRFTELAAFAARGSWYITPGARFICMEGSNEVILFDGTTGKEVGRLTGIDEGIHDAGFSANGKLMVTAGDALVVRVWDLDTLKEVRKFEPHDGFA